MKKLRKPGIISIVKITDFILRYLHSDLLLLADLFERFRDVNLKHFGIDPCHNYSAPGLTWQCGLKHTNVELDLLTEPDCLLSFEKSIRGGISGVMGKRYFKADDEFKLLYIDANNLYGWTMKQEMPLKDFKMYQPEEEITKENILGIPDDSAIPRKHQV